MDYLELSLKNVKIEAEKLADYVADDFIPDAVIFVSKGSYQIGMAIGEHFNIPVAEIFAKREGGKLKKIISPVLQIIPSTIKRKLRKFEVQSDIHSKKNERSVFWGYIPQNLDFKKINKVLLVDDSCDTGNTFLSCVNVIKEQYSHLTIKTAALNVFTKSLNLFCTDYYLYKDTMIQGPWSNDSREHKEFVNIYKNLFK